MQLVNIFPLLAKSGFRITSPATRDYNCIAWAAGHNHNWWEPDPEGTSYWPQNAPRNYSLAAYVAAFETIGYVACADGTLESGFEKVAVYARHGEPTHAAKQLPNGLWSSKLGHREDIEHGIDALVGECYGEIVQFLRRPVP